MVEREVAILTVHSYDPNPYLFRLVGYYTKFIENFSQIAAPLTDMTNKRQSKTLQWTEETTASFEMLKEKMSSAPVMKLPKLEEQFIIRTDASGNGLVAVLMQESEGELFPVTYVSRKLKGRNQICHC